MPFPLPLWQLLKLLTAVLVLHIFGVHSRLTLPCPKLGMAVDLFWPMTWEVGGGRM